MKPTGLVDEVAIVRNILTVHGYGLKLEALAGLNYGQPYQLVVQTWSSSKCDSALFVLRGLIPHARFRV
jgi:hypothetical protein